MSQTVAVCERAYETRGDFRADHRSHGDSQSVLEQGYIEPGEMHELGDALIRKQSLQVRAVLIAPAKRFRAYLNEMGLAIACRELHEAESVTMRIETHGFGIDRNDRTQIEIIGQIAIIEMN